jgi:hypothetical protein
MKLKVGTGPVPNVKVDGEYKRQPDWLRSWEEEDEFENTESYSDEECEKCVIVDFMLVDDLLQVLDLNPKKSLGKILNSKVKILKDMLIPTIDTCYETPFVYLVLVMHIEEFMYILHKVVFRDQICPDKRRNIFFALIINGYIPTPDLERLSFARKTAVEWMRNKSLKIKKP